jgi:iron complex transport system substrate-binding protein
MRLILVLATLLTCAGSAQNVRRIVSTAPSFTETLFALGAGDRVVAVSQYCHFPAAETAKLPRVGSYLSPNVEAIAKLQPDLVVVHAEQKQVLAQMERLGLRTLAVRNTTLEDTLQSARAIGAAIGLADAGVKLENSLRSQLREIEQAAAKRTKRRTLLFVVGRTPGRLDGMIAVGRGSFLNEVIRIAGGRNVLDSAPVVYPRIAVEGVLRLDPDVVVDMGDMAVTTGVSEEHKRAVVRLWEAQPGIRAATERRVFAVAADIFVVPGPRVVETAEEFARMLYSEGSTPKP